MGECFQLTDAHTNVRWGLKHLSLAIGSSGGDLQFAASKHNGGLGCKSLVQSYIAKVFPTSVFSPMPAICEKREGLSRESFSRVLPTKS
jgi:hypothetical protein